MRRHVLSYGLLGGALILLLKAIEYKYLVIDHSFEIYGGLVAVIFAATGIWLGQRLTRPRDRVVIREIEVRVPAPVEFSPVVSSARPPEFSRNEAKREQLGITRRELEILGLMAAGLSNREIAEKIFVSENTVKTHSSHVFDKLGARRRTQAVQLGKDFGLIP